MKTYFKTIFAVLFLFSTLCMSAQTYIEMGVTFSYCSSSELCSPNQGCIQVNITNLTSSYYSYKGYVKIMKKTGPTTYVEVAQKSAAGFYISKSITFNNLGTGDYVPLVSLTHNPFGGPQYTVNEKYNAYFGGDPYDYKSQLPKGITVTVPVVANFEINGEQASTSSVISTCTSDVINLQNTSTGSQSTSSPTDFEYRIILSETNPSGGGLTNTQHHPVGGGFSSSSLSTLDLKSVFPVLNTTPNFYQVKLEVKNDCNGSVSSKIGRIELLDLIPTNINTKFANAAGVYNITPGSSCATSSQVGRFNGSFKFVGTSGEQLESYYLKVEHVCGSSGVVVDGRNTPTTIPSGTSISDIAVNIGSYISQYSSNGFFYWYNNPDTYKITITLTNPCGDTQQTYWVTNTGSWKTALDRTSIAVKIAPNPFADYCVLKYTLEEDAMVGLRLMDVTGKTVLLPFEGKQQTSGNHSFSIPVEQLANGMYFYELQINKETLKGKLLKSN